MRWLSSIILIFLFLSSSCSSNRSQPEDEIYAFINTAENFIEEHQGRKAKQVIAIDYSDDRQRSKKDLEQILTYYLLKHKKIHILKHISSITFSTPENSTAIVFAAMAGRGGEIKDMLATLQTDVYRFTFTLKKAEDSWLLISADWTRASAEDIEEIWGSIQ